MRNHGIGSWPARRARTGPDKAAIIHEGTTYTAADVLARSTRLANALRGLGVGRGDRVAYLGPNHPSCVEALFASGMLGAVLLPLNTRLAAPEHEYVLRDAEPVALIWSPECARGIEPIGAEVLPEAQIVLGPATAVAQAYEPLLTGASAAPVDEPVELDDLCMIQYTSGTSGHPKGVMLSHGNVAWNCINLLIDVDVRTAERNLVVAPLFHTAGMNNSFLPPFLKGAAAYLMQGWSPEKALELIESKRISFMVGVPTIFQAMAQSPRWKDTDLSSLRTLLCGSAPLPLSLIETYAARGLYFQQGYGLTETSPNATFLRADAIGKEGSAGTPCFFTDLRVVSPDGVDTAAGERGEVLAQGPNVTRGYWKRPEATAASFVDGDWLRTGDVAVRDADGFVFIVDRVKDVIISGGENIYPAEVENALYGHPAIRECAVIGVPDARWGEVGRAMVVFKEGREASAAALGDFLAERIARYKIPKSFVAVDALPRTASGKLLKRVLRETSAGTLLE
ncbi:MAG TPA: long-chain fatty acid--CoA ligase [Nevskiaceae bacterium]